MATQVIMSQKQGPLPITATFSALSDAPGYLEIAGSVWTTTANKMIGIQAVLDGNVLGTAQIFSNTASTHRAVVTAYFKVQLPYGQHSLTLNLNPGSPTTSDINDFFTAVLHW